MNNRPFTSSAIDGALLLLRLWTGLLLFFQHGLVKLTHFSQFASHFPDPLHLGPVPTLLFAALSDAVCSLLIAVGLFTRFAAAIIVINTAAAFTFVHHMKLSGPGNGELALLFLGPALVLVISGAGRYSIDANIWRKRGR